VHTGNSFPAGTQQWDRSIAPTIGHKKGRPFCTFRYLFLIGSAETWQHELFGIGLRIPADFGKVIADESEKWSKVIRTPNIKAGLGATARADIP